MLFRFICIHIFPVPITNGAGYNFRGPNARIFRVKFRDFFDKTSFLKKFRFFLRNSSTTFVKNRNIFGQSEFSNEILFFLIKFDFYKKNFRLLMKFRLRNFLKFFQTSF